VATLLEFNGDEEKAAVIPRYGYGKDLEKISSAYLKGLPLEALKLQFPQYTIEEMEGMLRAEGISIVDQGYTPKKTNKFYRRRR